jgi:heme exporter protein C
MAGWIMWGIMVVSFRYAAELREQRAEQKAAVAALETV